MFQFGKFQAPTDVNPVILAREPSKLLRNEFFNKLEPQSIKPYHNHQAAVYIDNIKDNATGNPLVVLLQSSTLFARYINKIAIHIAFMDWVSPNVNPRNQTVTFFSTNSAANHTVAIPEGFYTTPTLIMAALVIALNTASGASGLTFSHLINPLQPASSTLSSAGGSYHFVLSSPMITHGTHLIGLPLDQANTASKIVGSIQLYYTRWVDIISSTLTKHTKNPNTSNSFGNNSLLFRFYNAKNQDGLSELKVVVQNRDWFNWDFSETITNIDFRLTDEFGEELYVPQYAIDNDSFSWGLVLSTSVF